MTNKSLSGKSPTPSTSISRRCLKAFFAIGTIGITLGAVLGLGKDGGLSTLDKLWVDGGYFLADIWFDNDAACPQVDVLVPESNRALWTGIGENILSDPFKSQAVSWLSGAIRIR
jgi:hypothetical protein